MLTLFTIAALWTAQGEPSWDEINWGATRDQLAISVPDLRLETGTKPTAEGLILGARATLQQSSGLTMAIEFFFTPLSGKLGQVRITPTPTELCLPLLAEWKQKFGQGVELTTIPEIKNWAFSDLRANTRWNYYVVTVSKRTPTCAIVGSPLSGTANLR